MRLKYVLSEVVVGLWRNVTMTIAMMITMAVSLTLLGASVLLYLQVNHMREVYYEQVEVTIFLKTQEADTEEHQKAIDADLQQDPLVLTFAFETQEQAYERFKIIYANAPELVAATKPESLPESFRIKLKDPNSFDAFDEKYKGRDGIDRIIDQKQLVEKVFTVLGSLQTLALIIAVVQGVAALMLVINTIQVAAYSKRREVAVMKLVGASNWFIQAPFVLEAVAAGFIRCDHRLHHARARQDLRLRWRPRAADRGPHPGAVEQRASHAAPARGRWRARQFGHWLDRPSLLHPRLNLSERVGAGI